MMGESAISTNRSLIKPLSRLLYTKGVCTGISRMDARLTALAGVIHSQIFEDSLAVFASEPQRQYAAVFPLATSLNRWNCSSYIACHVILICGIVLSSWMATVTRFLAAKFHLLEKDILLMATFQYLMSSWANDLGLKFYKKRSGNTSWRQVD